MRRRGITPRRGQGQHRPDRHRTGKEEEEEEDWGRLNVGLVAYAGPVSAAAGIKGIA